MKQPLRLTAATLLTVFASGLAFAEPAKVGFIYNGPIGDVGWTYQHDLGRQEMEKALGSKVAVRTIPNTSEGPDGARVARELTADGSKMVYAVGFGYMRDVLKLAAENPNTCYAVATGYMTAPNVSGYSANWHEGGYLAGIVAGRTTKTNAIGFVAAHPIPVVMSYVNAFAVGARSVNPNATIRVVFVGSWSDPPKESDAANALMNSGVDVMAHYTNFPAVMIAADARNIPSISFHSDMRKYAPKHYLTGVTHHWGTYYTKTTSEAIGGHCPSGLYVGGIKDGSIKLAPLSPSIPKDVAQIVEAKTREIADGRLNVFAGPLKDNKGVIRVQSGANLSDADVGKMDWFVDGVSVGQR
ncbi:MAG: BMP family ABC transporter substrate-binding protein [Proteobacteria bacterium]|nr:BMP family ABC transporter substrate-binding protein [Pseudomonadota bacterium]